MSNYAKFFALLNKAHEEGHKVQRSDLIYGFTEGRTESLKHVSAHELKAMENHLSNLVNNDDDKADRMRKKIISCFHNMNFRLPNGKVNMKAVEAWVLKYGYLHKPLNDYTAKELPRLVTQAERYEKSVLE